MWINVEGGVVCNPKQWLQQLPEDTRVFVRVPRDGGGGGEGKRIGQIWRQVQPLPITEYGWFQLWAVYPLNSEWFADDLPMHCDLCGQMCLLGWVGVGGWGHNKVECVFRRVEIVGWVEKVCELLTQSGVEKRCLRPHWGGGGGGGGKYWGAADLTLCGLTCSTCTGWLWGPQRGIGWMYVPGASSGGVPAVMVTDDKGIKGARPSAVGRAAQALGFEVS